MKRSLLFAMALVLTATICNASHHDSYVLHFGRGNSTTISGSLEDFDAVRGTLSGDYLWIRHNGRAYVITDRARLAEAWDYFAPERELSAKQRAVAEETQKLERESDRLEDAQDDRALTRAEHARLDELHAQERELARREQALDDREGGVGPHRRGEVVAARRPGDQGRIGASGAVVRTLSLIRSRSDIMSSVLLF
jgi:multidrug efflux pump subunit AcrA (membrane-fusion protein)